MHQPFRVYPAQRMTADVELSSIIAQHHAVAEEFMRLNAAPHSALGGDPHRVGRDVERGQAKSVEVRQPRGLIGEACCVSAVRRASSGADKLCLRM